MILDKENDVKKPPPANVALGGGKSWLTNGRQTGPLFEKCVFDIFVG